MMLAVASMSLYPAVLRGGLEAQCILILACFINVKKTIIKNPLAMYFENAKQKGLKKNIKKFYITLMPVFLISKINGS